jgi:hypothetical protein
VLDTGDLRQQFFQGDRHLALGLPRRQARRLDQHIDHRHDDLRLFLARRQHQRHGTGDDADQEYGQRQGAAQRHRHESVEQGRAPGGYCVRRPRDGTP